MPEKVVIGNAELWYGDLTTALELDADAYRRLLPGLLAEHQGKFVLIRSADQIQIFDTREQALAEGYKRFKREPFFVREIAPLEPLPEMTHGPEICRT
jgi:hypothetical protein